MFELSIGMVKKVITSLNHVGNIGCEGAVDRGSRRGLRI